MRKSLRPKLSRRKKVYWERTMRENDKLVQFFSSFIFPKGNHQAFYLLFLSKYLPSLYNIYVVFSIHTYRTQEFFCAECKTSFLSVVFQLLKKKFFSSRPYTYCLPTFLWSSTEKSSDFLYSLHIHFFVLLSFHKKNWK